MKPAIAWVLGLLTATSCYGIPYRVVALFTVDSSTDHRVAVGKNYTADFRYESDTVDGTFETLFLTGPALGVNTSLDFTIHLPDELIDGMELTQSQTMLGRGMLTVSGGVVTGFNWMASFGPWFWTASGFNWGANFTAYDILFEKAGGLSGGTFVFSAPSPVADTGSSLVLLSFALAALVRSKRSFGLV